MYGKRAIKCSEVYSIAMGEETLLYAGIGYQYAYRNGQRTDEVVSVKLRAYSISLETISIILPISSGRDWMGEIKRRFGDTKEPFKLTDIGNLSVEDVGISIYQGNLSIRFIMKEE